MYEFEILSTVFLTVFLLVCIFIIIRESRSPVNISFAFATLSIVFGNILGTLGFIAAGNQDISTSQLFWGVGTIFLVLSPSGFYFSANLIYFGKTAFSRVESFIWLIFTVFVITGIMLIYPLQTEMENILTWDPVMIILLSVVAVQYYRLYLLNTEWQSKVALIISGFTLDICGLSLNTLILLVTGESTPLRQITPVIGLILVISAFIVIPENQREVKDWKQLNIQNTEMELLIDLLTHDLRNHITTSQGFVELSLAKIEDGKLKEYLLKSNSGNVRAMNLLTTVSILMKTKMDYKYQLQPTSLKKAIDNSNEILKGLYPRKKVVIEVNSIADKDTVLADSLFEHLLLNILTNAVKNDNKEVVKIEIEGKTVTPGRIQLSIVDHGKGIAPEEKQGIFERYTQFRKEGKGSDLGLFIVSTLVKRYKGRVQIESTVAGDHARGTTVKLELLSGS